MNGLSGRLCYPSVQMFHIVAVNLVSHFNTAKLDVAICFAMRHNALPKVTPSKHNALVFLHRKGTMYSNYGCKQMQSEENFRAKIRAPVIQ